MLKINNKKVKILEGYQRKKQKNEVLFFSISYKVNCVIIVEVLEIIEKLLKIVLKFKFLVEK